jgi:cytochrome c oxidase cbb3-type subunit 2
MLHLYEPTAVVTESNQPPYRYLFETRKISGQASSDALKLTGKYRPKDGYEVVPTPAAKALVGYLLTLDRSHEVNELKEGAAARAAAAPAPAAAAPAAK